MKFVKNTLLLISTTFLMMGFAQATPDLDAAFEQLINFDIEAADNIQNNYVGDSGIDFVTGGIKYVPYPKEKDVNFRNFLTLCFESGTTKPIDGAKRVLKLISSDQPWQVLDDVSYSPTQTSLIGDFWKDGFMSCADAYQTVKANYWQRFRTHKAMSEFVNKYVANADQLKAYLAKHSKKEPRDDSTKLL